MATTVEKEKMYTVREISRVLDLSDAAVRLWVTQGELEAIRVGARNQYMIPQHILRTFLSERLAVAASRAMQRQWEFDQFFSMPQPGA